VQQTAFGEYGETLRTISLNGNVEVARAAFRAAVRCYPHERWVLLLGAYIVEKYEPGGGDCTRIQFDITTEPDMNS
jgi:hypothetical protein